MESLPYFTKSTASTLIGKKGRNLDQKIDQLIRIGYLKTLKKGLYVTDPYSTKTDNLSYIEFIGNVLREPSYISSEYVLANSGLIPESVFSLTLITTKTTRKFSNFLGNFIYRNIKPELFLGFNERKWSGKTIFVATKAKAIFDFFYLKNLKYINSSVADARINWYEFSQEDLEQFKLYVKLSNSQKMQAVLKSIEKQYADYQAN